RRGARAPFPETATAGRPLKTVRVGVPRDTAAGGTATTSGTACPRPSKTSETPLPLSENQKGPVGLKAIPQGLTRFESVTRAKPGTSEASLTRAYPAERRHRSSRHSSTARYRCCRPGAGSLARKNRPRSWCHVKMRAWYIMSHWVEPARRDLRPPDCCLLDVAV